MTGYLFNYQLAIRLNRLQFLLDEFLQFLVDPFSFETIPCTFWQLELLYLSLRSSTMAFPMPSPTFI